MYTGIVHRSRLGLTLTLAGALGAISPLAAKSLTVIYSFDASADLNGGLVADAGGTLYGVIGDGGGCGNFGCVYSLSPPAQKGGAWTYATIYEFRNKGDGYGPQGQLTLGPDGSLFGTTGYGSSIVFQLTPPAGGSGTWAFTSLAVLGGGFSPDASAPLMLSGGALYGISTGGSQTCPYVGCGGVYEVAPAQGGGWTLTTIAAFDGGSLGGSPAGLAGPDAQGGFYVANQYGGKVVYLKPYDSMWQAAVAASYPRSQGLGCLVLGTNGDIYGVAGNFSRGKFFQLQPDNGATSWTKTTLAEVSDHHYAPCLDIPGPGGSLIGTVFGDQDFYDGDIFQLVPPSGGSGAWTYKILSHVGQTGDYGPINAVFGLDGDLYAPVNIAYGPPSAIVQYRFK